ESSFQFITDPWKHTVCSLQSVVAFAICGISKQILHTIKNDGRFIKHRCSQQGVEGCQEITEKTGEHEAQGLVQTCSRKTGRRYPHKTVKKWILKSDQFSIDGKTVSLTKKRSKEESKEEIPSKKARKGDDTKSLTSVEEWRNDNKIVVKHAKDDDEGQKESKRIQQDETYFPFTTFEDCRALMESSLIRQCTDANKFQKPSPIQAQSWPILMHHKRDVVGIAETGSGKTLAFGIPALSSMSKESKSGRRLPRMLVLSPTRELAMQVETVLQEYGKVDLINEGSCDLSKVQHLVLDEADRMLDMGFEEDVKFIISQCMPKEDGRQTAMFSATWPAAIQDIAMNYMIDPIRIYVGFEAIVGSNGENNIDDSLSANKRVEQHVEVIEDRMRDRRLRELLRQHQQSKQRILIFALYKKEAERLEHALNREGFNVCSIHGNKHQGARTQALSDFKDGKCQMMVATDVAARGLDIPDVELVVNYTFPLTIEDYVHRIGRTGRAGKTGISYTFFQPSDKSHAGELQQVIKQAGQEPPEELLKFGSTIKKKEHKLYGTLGQIPGCQ
ncbi:DEAD/DEAH box helicase domain protein, partial [Nitzschia inconspicua]